MAVAVASWATLGSAAVACNYIANLGSYAVGPQTPDATTPPGSAQDSSADAFAFPPEDAGADCGQTPAQSPFTTGCTNATCAPFDDDAHVVSGFLDDGGLPPLPEASAPVVDAAKDTGAAPDDAATDDAALDDGAASDAASPYPPCSSLPNPVYMMGSNPLLPVVQQLGTWANAVGITLVYTQLSSCKGVSAIVQNVDAIKAGATTSTYWDPGSNPSTCAIDDQSKYADIGLSSVFMQTCLPTTTGFSGVQDFQGPIVTAVWFVPHASTQTSISAEAAYLLYSGLGQVLPWNDRAHVYLRGATGGTQVMMGAAIGVPGAQWVGTTTGSSDAERSAVIASTAPESTLGLGEIDYAEDSVGTVNLNELAFRDYGQPCAYYPNSTATSHDKRNVRDGHYVGWGPAHLIARVNAQGVPVNAAAGQIIDYFIGNTPVPGHDFLSLVISNHLVPTCAMNVQRTSEVGPVSPYLPSPSCACFFDSVVGTTSCPTCTTSADCPASSPACNLGYCEPR
jgi:hypothetical protein